jgi:L-alanine-DL-glutamate epimerase-like enolase superfamily enzyme
MAVGRDRANVRVTKAELVRSTEPVTLPEPWLAAWRAPDGDPVESFDWSVVRVHTDAGVVGVGPGAGDPRGIDVVGTDPFEVGAFWEENLGGRRAGTSGRGAAGVEIALWDAAGKAAGRSIHELLGGVAGRVPVYAATSRLLDPEDLDEQVCDVREAGFEAVKLRLHRPDPADDLAAVRAVREAVGESYTIFVDANQNNHSGEYEFWSRRTARRMARELDDLGVAFLEEPRPRRDVEGLARIAEQSDLSVAGGEHSATPHDFKPHLQQGAYDILQPDVLLGGNMGIGGLRRTATVADFFERTVIPHVCGNAETALGLAATLQVAGAEAAMPMVEYPYDPPVLTPSTTQPLAADPILVGDDGGVPVPDGPGLGIDLDGEWIDAHGEVVWTAG